MTLTKQEYTTYDAIGLADLVKSKQVSPPELINTAIQIIEEKNPALNAVIYKSYDSALKAAQKIDINKPLAGVPFLLKDLNSITKDEPITCGSRFLKDFKMDHNSHLMQRYQNSGLISLGKTNTPEFGLMAVTEPELYGPTRNPWNTALTPGGSSGGSAAAVASGMVPCAD